MRDSPLTLCLGCSAQNINFSVILRARFLPDRDHFVQDGKNEVMDAAGENFFFELDISTNAYRFVHP